MKNLESRIKAIEDRNKRVEDDKRWETSIFRRLLITILTYIVVAGFLLLVEADRPFLIAIVPATGYFLSSLVISPIKHWWLNK